ncbi:MAG: hypothetical protein ACK4G3_06915 [bacterium]
MEEQNGSKNMVFLQSSFFPSPIKHNSIKNFFVKGMTETLHKEIAKEDEDFDPERNTLDFVI